MEITASAFFGGIKRFRRRRRYARLGGGQKKDTRGRKWRFNYKIRVTKLRPRLIIIPPLKLLRRFRDAYVKMMLNFAGHLVQLSSGGNNVFVAKRIPEMPHRYKHSISSNG